MKVTLEFDLTKDLDRSFHDAALQAPQLRAALYDLAEIINSHPDEYLSRTVLQAHLRVIFKTNNLDWSLG